MVEIHYHPKNKGEVVIGRRLVSGERIKAGDVYDSSCGKWEKAPCPGLVIQAGSTTYWVRKEE